MLPALILLSTAIFLQAYTFGAVSVEEPMATAECSARSCQMSARRIQDFVDETVDPCEDFYQFACGRWMNSTSIPGSQSSWDQFLVLRDQLLRDARELLESEDGRDVGKPVRQARALYNMCMDTGKLEQLGIRPVLEMLKKVGLRSKPPRLEESAGESFDWVRVLSSARRLLGLNLLFKLWVGQDVHNSSRNVMMVDQVSLDISLEYLKDARRFRREVAAYRRYVEDVVDNFEAARVEVGDDLDYPEHLGDVSLGVSFAQDVLQFGMRLAKIARSREARRESGPVFLEMTLPQLQQLMDVRDQAENVRMNWARYLRQVLAGTGVTPRVLGDVLLVAEPRYLRRLSGLVARAPSTTLERFLWWGVASQLAPLTLKRFRDLGFRLARDLLGVTDDTPRWKTCVQIVNAHFGMAVAHLYVREHFDHSSKVKVAEMLEQIRSAFVDRVLELEWMDARTKRRAVKKAHSMRALVGYPDWLSDPAEVRRYYAQSEMADGEFFESVMKLSENSAKSSLQEIRAKPDPERWVMPPTAVNAFYSPVMNSMTFPAGILQPPFFNLGLTSLNYGAIGSIMGHELIHGFDDQGRRFDKRGNVRQWWTEATFQHYKDRVRCFVEQYSGYTVPQLCNQLFVNGVTTQGENIADNGGMRQALRAHRALQACHSDVTEGFLPDPAARYTHDQLFFLSFGMHMWCGRSTTGAMRSRLIEGMHSPNRYRVIGTLSNSAEFSQAWSCPTGSAMNPAKKCVLW